MKRARCAEVIALRHGHTLGEEPEALRLGSQPSRAVGARKAPRIEGGDDGIGALAPSEPLLDFLRDREGSPRQPAVLLWQLSSHAPRHESESDEGGEAGRRHPPIEDGVQDAPAQDDEHGQRQQRRQEKRFG